VPFPVTSTSNFPIFYIQQASSICSFVVLPDTNPLLLVGLAEQWPKSPFWHHGEQCCCAQQLKAPTQVAAETE